MKTRLSGLIAIIACATQFVAGQNFRVEATNDDISYYLDLKAVASVFGDANNLEDFERRINDYDNRISNLDLNNDGMIDYLRVIEKPDRNLNIVVIQAVLDRNVFQDVATIVAEQNRYQNSYVQIIGAPYIYGANYIIEPRYYATPRILTWFRSPYYRTWYSPYYWGYYPNYYRYRHPVSINIYFSWTNKRINHDHYYGYSNRWRSSSAQRTYYSISRNDFGNRYPERSYTRRNANSVNRYDMDKRRDQENGNKPGNRYDNNRPSGGTLNRYENSPASDRSREDGSYNRNQSSDRNQSDRNQNNGRYNSNPGRDQNNSSAETNNTRNNREYSNDRSSGTSVNSNSNQSNNSRQSSDRSSSVNRSESKNNSESRSSSSRSSERSGNHSSSNRESGGRR